MGAHPSPRAFRAHPPVEEPTPHRPRAAIVPPPLPKESWEERPTVVPVPVASIAETIPAPPPSGETSIDHPITLRSPPPDAPDAATIDPPPMSAIRELGREDDAPSTDREPVAR